MRIPLGAALAAQTCVCLHHTPEVSTLRDINALFRELDFDRDGALSAEDVGASLGPGVSGPECERRREELRSSSCASSASFAWTPRA